MTKDTVLNFGRAWDMGGIKMILDTTSIQFAMDFANVCLRSYVLDLMNKAAAQKAARAAGPQANAAVPPQANPVAAPAKPASGIIITDL